MYFHCLDICLMTLPCHPSMHLTYYYGFTLVFASLEPFLPLKYHKTYYDNKDADHKHSRISDGRLQLRHVDKVHAVPPRDERKRHKNARDDRKDRHDPVLPHIKLGLSQLSYVRSVV